MSWSKVPPSPRAGGPSARASKCHLGRAAMMAPRKQLRACTTEITTLRPRIVGSRAWPAARRARVGLGAHDLSDDLGGAVVPEDLDREVGVDAHAQDHDAEEGPRPARCTF